MSDSRVMVVETATRIFFDHCTAQLLSRADQGVWSNKLWEELERTGLADAARQEQRGGAGLDFNDLAAVLRVAAYHCAPVPIAETWLAERMLSAAGLPVLTGPLTVAPVLRFERLTLAKRNQCWVLSGTLTRVPWMRYARAIVALADSDEGLRTVVIEGAKPGQEGHNYANEPRDTLSLNEHQIQNELVGPPLAGFTKQRLLFEGALLRSIAMAGALERVLQLTIIYAGERVQFGRPIGKFQAVQQQISVLATQVAAATAAAHSAAESLDYYGQAFFQIASAKSRVGEAAGIGSAIAHQVHGAMGFTQEYPLHHFTRRLWAWRDEFGSEAEWDQWIGELVATELEGEKLWQFIIEPSAKLEQLSAYARNHIQFTN